MIPGAYEPNAPLHRAGQVTEVPPILWPERPVAVAADQEAYVVSASTRPATWLGQSAVMLKDLGLAMGLVLAAALVPVLLARAIAAVWGFVMGR